MNATKTVSIRIAMDGKADIKRDLAETAQSGQAAGDATAKAFDKGTAAIDRQKAAFDRIVAAQKQAASGAANQNAFNNVLGVGPAGKSAQDSAMFFQQVAQLKAQQIGSNFQGSLTQAFGIGTGFKSAADSAKVFEEELDKLGGKGGSSAAQMMALTAAIRHSFDAMIAGRPPIQALAMESGNLSFALGGGGLSGILSKVPTLLTALISPTAIVIEGTLGLAAAVVVVAAAYRSSIQDQKAFEESLTGVGKASGATAAGMEEVARQAAATGGVTAAEARKMEEAFARTGAIGFGSFSNLISITARYATTTGENMDQATKEISGAFADPAKGAEALNAKLGFLDDKTRQYITSLLDQNRQEDARQALMKALIPSLDQVGSHLDALGRIGHSVSSSWSGFWEGMKRGVNNFIDGPALDQKIKQLQELLATANKNGGTVETADAFTGTVSSQSADALRGQLAPLLVQQAARNATAATGAADQAARKYADTLGDLGRNVDADEEAHARLGEQLAANIKAFNDPAVRKHIANIQQAADGIDAQRHQYETWIPVAQKAAMLADLDTKSISARSPAAKAAIADARARIELSGQEITYSKANAQIQRDGGKAYADAAHDIQTQTDALRASTSASLDVAKAYLNSSSAGMVAEAQREALTQATKRGADADWRARQILADRVAQVAASGAQQVDTLAAQTAAQKRADDAVAAGTLTSEQARRQVADELSIRQQAIALTVAEGGAKDQLTANIQRLTAAYANDNAEQTRSQALGRIQDQKAEIDLLQKQIGLVNIGDSASAIQVAQLQAKVQLQREGVYAAGKEGQQIIANAGSLEILNQGLRLAQESRAELEQTFDTLGNDFSNFVRQGKTDWDSFRDFGLSALGDIAEELVKLSLLNPLKNALFGGTAPTLDSVGGLLGGGKGGGIGDAVSWVASLFHTGLDAGAVGAGGGPGRVVSPALFRNARRMHGGGIVGDEVPIIAKKGEVVGWPDQMADAYGGQGGAVHLHQGAKTVVIQGGAGPAEVRMMQEQFEQMDRDFERRAADTYLQLRRRA